MTHLSVENNSYYDVTTTTMQNLYSTWAKGMNEEEHRRSTNRLLRRLRIALIIWLISLIATIIWFSYSR